MYIIDSDALMYCVEFYNKRGASKPTISLNYVASGAEGNIYKCETTDPLYQDDIVPNTAGNFILDNRVQFANNSINLINLHVISSEIILFR